MTPTAAKTASAGDIIDVVAEERAAMRDAARAALGVTGRDSVMPLRMALREAGVGLYPAFALCALVIVDQFQLSAFSVLSPDVSNSLGLSQTIFSGIYALRMFALSAMAMPMAALVQRRPRRALVAVTTAFAWAFMTMFTGFAGGLLALLAVFVLDGASSGSVQATHPGLLFDRYPTNVRSRLFSLYTSSTYAALVLAPGLVALLTWLDLTWRGVFLVLGAVCVLVAVLGVGLRDPGFGGLDTRQVRELVSEDHGAAPVATEPEVDNTLRFFEAARRVLAVPTVRRLLVAYVLFGMFLAPLIAVLSFYLSDAFHLSATGRALYTALLPGPAIIAMLIFGRHGERWYAENPARLLRYTGLFLGTSVALMATSIGISNFIGYTVVSLIAYAGLAVGLPAMGVASLGLLPPQVRAHASALSGIAIYGAGALVGTLFLSGIDSRYGVGAAIVALAVPGVGAGIAIYSAHRTVNDDLDAFVNDVVEEEELHQLVAAGARLPMLACRHIDFAYDQLQVLFDVSFSVEEGEMLALLGTNGAGKSTLLRVISGLGLPSAGSVRMRGSDITYLDPKRRVDMGIMQIAGGKGTFPRLTVLENLRAFGYPHGNDRAKVEAGIEAVFDAFPRLAERRTQRAGTMSGGENQMLALGCAFIVKPRILLIDELSLGLAPKVVGELLEMVRRINAGGSAVVLVEQSVNIALSLVDHAYFMEKGQIKFDGPAKDLLERTDLLRSVFLQGAAKGMAAR